MVVLASSQPRLSLDFTLLPRCRTLLSLASDCSLEALPFEAAELARCHQTELKCKNELLNMLPLRKPRDGQSLISSDTQESTT